MNRGNTVYCMLHLYTRISLQCCEQQAASSKQAGSSRQQHATATAAAAAAKGNSSSSPRPQAQGRTGGEGREGLLPAVCGVAAQMTTLDSVFMYCTPALTVTRLRAQLSEQKMPQEHTPHRMQPQVDGSCVPGASYRPLSVPGSAVSMRLTALRPAEQCYGAGLHERELRRRKSSQSATRAHTTPDAASGGWLLRPGCIMQDADRARNRRHAPADSAAAG